MKALTAARLRTSLTKFQDLGAFLTKLEAAGIVQTLALVFGQVFASEHGKMLPIDIRDCLHLVTEQLIEETFRSQEFASNTGKTTSASDTSRAPVTDRGLADEMFPAPVECTLKIAGKDHIPQAQTKSTSSIRALGRPWTQSLQSSPTNSPLKRAPAIRYQRPHTFSQHSSPSRAGAEDLKGLSDFSNPVPTAIFTKTKRTTLEVRDLSPGPAYYTPEVTATKGHPTNVFVPRGGKRYEYHVPDTPGPAFYTPLRSFLARQGK